MAFADLNCFISIVFISIVSIGPIYFPFVQHKKDMLYCVSKLCNVFMV